MSSARNWRLIECGPIEGGRITVYGPPPEELYCVLGLDFAYGRQDGDYDAGVLLDGEGQQLLTVHGRWGPESFYGVLQPILAWYQPFVVGERQVGLPVLRQIYDGGYHWVYFDRDERHRAEPRRDLLGHATHAGDNVIPRLQQSIARFSGDGQLVKAAITIRDGELHNELCNFRFAPRSSAKGLEECRDEDLKWGAPPGEHDDLVMALALAVTGLRWLPEFPKPEIKFMPQTMGAIFGTIETLEKEKRDRSRGFSFGKS